MNKYNPHIHHRKSIRLKGYDYSQAGLYFITICCQNRACLFGEIAVGASLAGAQIADPNTQIGNMDSQMILNDAGKMVETQWLALKKRFTNIELHEYMIMPNHFHAIIEIVGASLVGAQIFKTDTQIGNSNTQNADSNTQNDIHKQNDIVPNITIVQNDNEINNFKPLHGRPQGHAPTLKTIGDMMDAFKSITTVEYIRGVKNLDWQPFNGKLWQRNYYEHIIRNEQSYQTISNYIVNNPAKWNGDKFFIVG